MEDRERGVGERRDVLGFCREGGVQGKVRCVFVYLQKLSRETEPSNYM